MSQNWILEEAKKYMNSFDCKEWDTAARVLRNIEKAYNVDKYEAARDHLAVFRVGHLFVNIECKLFFEESMNASNPHDLIVSYQGEKVVIEVKRLRKEKQAGDEFEKKLLNSDRFEEVPHNARILSTVVQIIRNTACQLEPDQRNIIWFVSANILFNAEDIKAGRWFEILGHRLLPDDDEFYQPIKYLTAVAWLHDYSNTTANPEAFFLEEDQHTRELLSRAEVVLG